MNTPLRARECGPCTACCSFIPIEAPGFYKPAGKACMQCVDGIGCGIYATRPAPCREFFCGWRVLELIPETMRPDLCGVMVAPDEDDIPAGYADMSGVKFIITDDGAALERRDFLECLAGLVHARAPTFLAIANPRADGLARIFLNRRLEAASEVRNGALMTRILRETLSELRGAIA